MIHHRHIVLTLVRVATDARALHAPSTMLDTYSRFGIDQETRPAW
jgi:hypothetical protein